MVLYVDTPWTDQIGGIERFQNVQDVLNVRKTAGPGGRKDDLMLTGLLHCHCNSPFHANGILPDGDRRLKCTNYKATGECTNSRGLSLGAVERAVLEEAKAILCDGIGEKVLLDMIVSESEERAASRRAKRDSLYSDLQRENDRLQDKTDADLPNDPRLRASWDRSVAKLTARIAKLEEDYSKVLAPVAVHTLSSGPLATLPDLLDDLIASAPITGEDEGSIRARAMVRAIVRKIDLDWISPVEADMTVVFDFQGVLKSEDDPRAVIKRKRRIQLTFRHEHRAAELEALVLGETCRLQQDHFEQVDALPMCRRELTKMPPDRRAKLYEAMLLCMVNKSSLGEVSVAVGLHYAELRKRLLYFTETGDVDRLGKLFKRLRPDLALDVTRLKRTGKKDHRNLRARLELVRHPILRHSLCSGGSERRPIDEDVWQKVCEAIPRWSYFGKRLEVYRRMLDSFFWIVRTGSKISDLPIDMGILVLRHATRYDLLHSAAFKQTTRILLESEGVIRPGARLIFEQVPTYTDRGKKNS